MQALTVLLVSASAYLILERLRKVLEADLAIAVPVKESESIDCVKISTVRNQLLSLHFDISF